MPSEARLMIKRLRLLTAWRRYVAAVVAAVQKLYPQARVYVIGGAAEGRLTALSDIDVLVVLPWEPSGKEKLHVSRTIYETAVEHGLPWDYPLNLHVTGPRGFERYRHHARRMVRLA